MSYALYNNLAGLRFWNQRELRLRGMIKNELVATVEMAALDLNQMWRFEEVETPLMMPMARMNAAYTSDDVFVLVDPPGGTEPFALRAETTDGTYSIAAQMLRESRMKPPICFYQIGTSFRRETSDGATAEKLRFNAFTQLEFQMLYAEGTTAPIAETIRAALVPVVEKLTGRPTRLIESDRLPAYSTETIDIEVELPNGEWREVASTSRRTDFPEIPGQKRVMCFEVAFGMDRMVAIARGGL